jgi:enamine deaminase RidA (YjgF/YER057c/UK114 family)
MFPIQRIPGSFPTRSWGSAYRDLVWALGMSDDFSLDFDGQARRAFENLDSGLAQAGTDKTRLISVQVYLEDVVAQKAAFDALWTDWIGGNPDHWPMRSCVQVTFTGGNRIELLATAVRTEPPGEDFDGGE